MGFAGDDGAGFTKLFDQPRIDSGFAVEVAIKLHAATGWSARKVEAIFYGDGHAPEIAAPIAEAAAGSCEASQRLARLLPRSTGDCARDKCFCRNSGWRIATPLGQDPQD